MDAAATCRSCGAPAEPGAVLCACGSLLATSEDVEKDLPKEDARAFWTGVVGGLIFGVLLLLPYYWMKPDVRRGALYGMVIRHGVGALSTVGSYIG